MSGTVARRGGPDARRRLTWPPHAPRVGMHLGVATGLLKAARRARQIGCTAIQIFSDNPTAWRRRAEPPADAQAFVDYCATVDLAPIAIHASYLVNLAGSAEPFATQTREGLVHELTRAPAYGATLVNTHIGSHRGVGHAQGLRRVCDVVDAILAETPSSARLVLENSSGGGDAVGATLDDLARIAASVRSDAGRLAFCLDTAHLWGAGYDISTRAAVESLLSRFDETIGLQRLALVHLNDSRSALGSRADRHEHIGAGQIGPAGLAAFLRDPRLATGGTAFMLETPGVDSGYDAINLRRARLLFDGATSLPTLPPKAFTLNRRSTRSGPRRAAGRASA